MCSLQRWTYDVLRASTLLMLMQLILVRSSISLGVALTLIFVTIKAINPRPIPILILGCHASVIHWSLPLLHDAKLWCDKDYGEVDAAAADVNTSVGVGDRRFPTASFDSARNESSGYVFSLLCDYLLPLLWCTWRALSCVSYISWSSLLWWEVGADQLRSGCRSVPSTFANS